MYWSLLGFVLLSSSISAGYEVHIWWSILASFPTLVLDQFYAPFERGHEVLRWALSALFAQELWFLSASPPTNGPLWSLSYEFWFYVLFGCWVFVRPMRWRLACVVVVSLIAGPKLLLLMPVWLFGVAAWVARKCFKFPPWLARAGIVLASGVAWRLIVSGWVFPTVALNAPWFYSGRWLSDWALGAAIATQVFCVEPAFPHAHIPAWIERPVRWWAGLTFSLYAYHFPLLVFAAAVVPYEKTDLLQVIFVLGLVLFCIIALWRFTECRREWWRVRFCALLASVASDPGRSAGGTT